MGNQWKLFSQNYKQWNKAVYNSLIVLNWLALTAKPNLFCPRNMSECCVVGNFLAISNGEKYALILAAKNDMEMLTAALKNDMI